MPNYIKLAVVGQMQDQEIVNIFYFAEAAGFGNAALDPAIRQAFALAYEGSHLPGFVGQLSDLYTATELQVSAVNELNVPTSSYTIFQSVSEIGAVAGATDSPGMVGIIGFQVSYPFVGAAVGQRVPKKSYIAYGPLVSDDIGSGGLVAWDPAAEPALTASLVDNVTLIGTDWHPIRIGTNVAGVGASGWVEGVIYRPYVRPRKSRMKRANGR